MFGFSDRKRFGVCLLSTIIAVFTLMVFNRVVYAGAATGDASISIAIPVQITQTRALNFGEVIRLNSGVGSWVLVDRNGVRTGGNVVLDNNAGVASGQFLITGEPNRGITVSLQDSTQLRNENGAVLNLTTYGDPSSRNIGSDGTDTYIVGGRVSLSENQPAGNYQGTYNITVSY